MKKILLYNWNTLDSNEGGGVAVYQKNIIKELKKNKNLKIVCMSSGTIYDNTKRVYMKKMENRLGIEEYAIVNSPVIAPVKQSQENFKNYVEDKDDFSKRFFEFVNEIDNFDIVHFNNLEGLTSNCIKIKENNKNIKVIYSAHNYFTICPQVNLWYKDRENCKCEDYNECKECFKYQKRQKQIIENRINCNIKNKNIRFLLNKINAVFSLLFEKDKKYKNENYYKKFVNINIENLNKYVDKILAVSDRVKQILVSRGIEKNKIVLSYIGNEFSNNKVNKCVYNSNSDIFNIVYLGPMRADKGFYFLKEAIKYIPNDIQKKISITFASRITDKKAVKELKNMKTMFYNIEIINGYSRDDLKNILKDKNLGIVPILWEDNLPQVTIEMVASGVPVLTGDLGGAKEIAKNENFIFKSGSIEDFCKKIINIYKNRNLLDDFYKKDLKLVTMEEHINELSNIYEINGRKNYEKV